MSREYHEFPKQNRKVFCTGCGKEFAVGDSVCEDAENRSVRCRECAYFGGVQWTSEEIEELQKRDQPTNARWWAGTQKANLEKLIGSEEDSVLKELATEHFAGTDFAKPGTNSFTMVSVKKRGKKFETSLADMSQWGDVLKKLYNEHVRSSHFVRYEPTNPESKKYADELRTRGREKVSSPNRCPYATPQIILVTNYDTREERRIETISQDRVWMYETDRGCRISDCGASSKDQLLAEQVHLQKRAALLVHNWPICAVSKGDTPIDETAGHPVGVVARVAKDTGMVTGYFHCEKCRGSK